MSLFFKYLSATSPYKTDGFNSGEMQNFPIRRDGEDKHIDVTEYVAVISDILRMKKNLCLCRHFYRLDKHFIAKYVCMYVCLQSF